ncbi:hypothetical protein KBX50_05045 [Micromonospora sp. C51]|uniref:hypothetical protein n=1 Tax=Micromonospora sp. C51 TaxID=2824879 RepID=UPI001B384934|nr:hypothetical protein [Micromonospora sp. C51]MBQ1047824.1 hypothetical protein [Micromonospora sp. C51]
MPTTAHELIITDVIECQRNTRRYVMRCPGLTDDCRAWIECRHSDCRPEDLDDNDGFGHGVEHRYVAGCWSLPLDYCFLADGAGNGVSEAAEELHLPPGHHLVVATFRDDDGGVEQLHVVTDESPATRDGTDPAASLSDRHAQAVSLCEQYRNQPPPLFQGPALSEYGQGYNAGTRDLARAVLAILTGEAQPDGDSTPLT